MPFTNPHDIFPFMEHKKKNVEECIGVFFFNAIALNEDWRVWAP